jgi:rhodanese-related sulfurtransferase
MPVTKGIKQLVAEAEEVVVTLTPEQALAECQQGRALMVDIRDIRERQRDGFIADSFHAPRGMLEFWVDPESPYHKTVLATEKTLILQCASGWRSALSAAALMQMGLDNVAHVGGGIGAWKKGGLPLETAD